VKNKLLTETNLAPIARRFREQAGKSRAGAAREMKGAQGSVFRAEENPEESLLKLRVRMIEAYSPYRVTGPVYLLKRK